MQKNTHIALTIAALLAAPSTSFASGEQRPALPAPTTSINVCVHTQSGEITVVDTAAGCKRNEQFLNIPISGALGPVGPQGFVGPIGAQGPQGLKGDIGATGAQGEIGDVGSTGPEGPTGAKGAIGPQGPKGPQGPQGATGDQGRMGSPGAAGEPGSQGPQGFQGAQGPQGPAGSPGAIGLFRFDQDFAIPSSESFGWFANFPHHAADLYCPNGASILGATASPVPTSVAGEHVSLQFVFDYVQLHWYNLDLFTKPFRVTMWCAWTR